MPPVLLTPQFFITFGIFSVSAGTAIAMNFKGRKPRQSLAPPMVNPHTVILLAGAVALFAGIHLMTLLGWRH
jgi:hypothetical protein